ENDHYFFDVHNPSPGPVESTANMEAIGPSKTSKLKRSIPQKPMKKPSKSKPAADGVNPPDSSNVNLNSLPRRLRGSSPVSTPECEEDNPILDGGLIARYEVTSIP